MMDNAKAKAVLVELCEPPSGEVSAEGLHCGFPLVDSAAELAEPGQMQLDGTFTADQLEAIAAWMRDPKGVSES